MAADGQWVVGSSGVAVGSTAGVLGDDVARNGDGLRRGIGVDRRRRLEILDSDAGGRGCRAGVIVSYGHADRIAFGRVVVQILAAVAEGPGWDVGECLRAVAPVDEDGERVERA